MSGREDERLRCPDAPPRDGDEVGFVLPTVSVIVINFNYGNFLEECVRSVMQQSYPHIECIVIDNASTDTTSDILPLIESQFSEVKVVRLDRNAGQCAAAIEGYLISKGTYVVFLDADDALLPHFIATHILVHLSMRKPVGLTSSDLLQTVGRQIVVGTFQNLGRAITKRIAKGASPVRRFDLLATDLWSVSRPPPVCDDEIIFIPSTELDEWIWSPTSGNCFRRDALDLFMGCKALATLQFALDAFLVRAIHSVTGSALIDRPLGIYRVHGGNVFSKCAHLNGLIGHDPGNEKFNERLSRQLIIDHMVDKYDDLAARFYDKNELIKIIENISNLHPALLTEEGDPYFLHVLKTHRNIAEKNHINIPMRDLRVKLSSALTALGFGKR